MGVHYITFDALKTVYCFVPRIVCTFLNLSLSTVLCRTNVSSITAQSLSLSLLAYLLGFDFYCLHSRILSLSLSLSFLLSIH